MTSGRQNQAAAIGKDRGAYERLLIGKKEEAHGPRWPHTLGGFCGETPVPMRSVGSGFSFAPSGAVMRRVQDRIFAAAPAGEYVLLAEVSATQKTEITYDHIVKELAEELELVLSIVSGGCRFVLLDRLHAGSLLLSQMLK